MVRTKDYVCLECGLRFSKPSYLRSHQLSHSDEKQFQCTEPNCNKAYTRPDHLRRHIRTQHQEEDRKYQCQQCGAKFVFGHGLTRHIARTHNNEDRPYECPTCQKCFKKKKQLQKHSFVHTGILPFPCLICDKKFMYKSKFQRHMLSHEKPVTGETGIFICGEINCGQIFSDKDARSLHVKENHQEFNSPDFNHLLAVNVCEICDKIFRTTYTLENHMKTHETTLQERKVITCPVPLCNKSYTRSNNLRKHIAVAHSSWTCQPVLNPDSKSFNLSCSSNVIVESSNEERGMGCNEVVQRARCTIASEFICPYEECSGRNFKYNHVLQNHIIKIHKHPQPRKKRKVTEIDPVVSIIGCSS